ncbi:hypothetical protein B0H10DRAFT_2243458 [Mycena sp. CBHHK59/15]|nr:hypothetical protein B0H10DRAFT_2243458 [Mycena sp. CBHHK59/15]
MSPLASSTLGCGLVKSMMAKLATTASTLPTSSISIIWLKKVALEMSATHAVMARLPSPQFMFTLAAAPSTRFRGHEESSDDDSDDDDALTIVEVLQELHKKYPALNYLQYSPALEAKGIIYARK